MTSVTRSFYRRLYLLTRLLPALILALLSYGAAWLFSLSRLHPAVAGGGGFALYGFILFIGLSRHLSAAGFLLSGIPRAKVTPTAEETARLAAALALPDGSAPALVRVVEVGEVPFAAAGGLLPGEIWVSRHAIRNLPPQVLRAVCLHEAAHATQSGISCAWQDMSWALAFPIAIWLRGLPLLIPVAAALHLDLWLHFELWTGARAERQADLRAAEVMGRLEYARALAAYLKLVAGAGAGRLAWQRLVKMGFAAGEVASILADER